MLIIDMPMPECCVDCPMIAYASRGMICLCTEALLEIDYDKKCPSWCPIKGELPEEHGDLIDTSAVVGSIKRETDIHDVTLKEYLGFKFPVQTIVPIDEFLENRKTIPIIVAAERKDDETTAD